MQLKPLYNLRCTDAPRTPFVDHADIIQYIDLPSREAVYEILRSALWEFVRKGIVHEKVRVLFSLTSRCPFNFNFIHLPSR
ncbi:hypothetical protein BV22DRAFT_1022666 [Leucogyrophana mollusca]|uniref:Uncharacterized protein n=1 Tax=Leucogyrophana mollusca TaxID=85980 RepID=A0ACB8B1T5_9AGAM|nr:hypothetical protein BV22DRAFT_1022666 [Leucogyrophana mollusca]